MFGLKTLNSFFRIKMFANRRRLRWAPGLAALALLLAGCAGVDARIDDLEAEIAAGEPAPEPTAAPVPEDPTALTNANANVREGPGTGHPIAFWVVAATEVAVTGRNADGTWLRIGHADRSGWIFGGLLDIGPDVVAGLPEVAVAAPEVVLVPTRTPEPAPEPAPAEVAAAPEPAAPEPVLDDAHVTGTVVNLRLGPGTNYPIDGQARAGDRLRVRGRNADGTWLQVADPSDADGRLWIYTPLTDLDPAAARVRVVEAVAPPVPPTAEPTVPAAGPYSPQDNPGLPVNPLSISAGGFFTCAVRADGTLVCWGNNRYQQAKPPGGTFHTVSASDEFACGLRTDGTAICWGNAYHPPNPNEKFTLLDNGGWHACGIRTDGTITCWTGQDRFGAASPPSGTFRALGLGNVHSCGIRTDGVLACWGDNDKGQSSPPGGAFRAVSSGAGYSCGIRTDGTITCWGGRDKVLQPPSGTFSSIEAGDFHSCGIRTDGALACWGDNVEGQSSPPGGAFRAVSSGNYHTCGVRTDGAVFCWGSNRNGALGP